MNSSAQIKSDVSVKNTPKKLISPRFSSTKSLQLKYIQPSQLPFIDEVKSKLQNGEYKYEDCCCPCGGKKDVIISEIDRYGLPLNSVLCLQCGTIRISPYLASDSLDNFYSEFYQRMYGRVTDLDSYFLKQKKYGEKILAVAQQFLKPGSCVYEVGCGAGGALKIFQDRGDRVIGCDYSAELIEAGRQRGVSNIYCGSFVDLEERLQGIKVDFIYLYKVFEHLSDPISFLEDCKNYLAPKGRILIVVPDISRIDSCPNPRGDLLQFFHIAHKFNFSFEGIKMLSNKVGFFASQITPKYDRKDWFTRPELWVEMTLEKKMTPKEKNNNYVDKIGKNMLHYLIKTEKLYSLNMCQGQLLYNSVYLPKRVWQRLKQLISFSILS